MGPSVHDDRAELAALLDRTRPLWATSGPADASEAAQRAVIEQAVMRVRDGLAVGDWETALAAYLHDRHLQHDDAFKRGAEQARRGELIDL